MKGKLQLRMKYLLTRVGCCLVIGVFACHSNSTVVVKDPAVTRDDTLVKQIKKDSIVNKSVSKDTIETIKLDYGFEAQVHSDYVNSLDIPSMKLSHNGKSISIGDKDSTTYIKENKLYPIINRITEDVFELMVEVDNRPNKNTAQLFRIEHDKIVSKKMIPTFITKASDLKGDGTLEYAGMWDYSEEYGGYRTYDPIEYYQLTDNGIKLDSSYMIKQNTMTYGKFMGYRNDGKAAAKMSNGCNERITKEFERIKECAKK